MEGSRRHSRRYTCYSGKEAWDGLDAIKRLAWSLQSSLLIRYPSHSTPYTSLLTTPSRPACLDYFYLPSTSTMSPQHDIQLRVTILCSTLLSVAIAVLSWANAPRAIILRNRARSNYINTTNDDVLTTAIATALFTIYGFVITVHPRWLRKHKGILPAFAIFQIFLATNVPHQARSCGFDRPMGLIQFLLLLQLSPLSVYLITTTRITPITWRRQVVTISQPGKGYVTVWVC
jgi:hypothetical protein